MYNFDPYNVFLAITINIPVLLMTAFVLQGHVCLYFVTIAFYSIRVKANLERDVRIWGEK